MSRQDELPKAQRPGRSGGRRSRRHPIAVDQPISAFLSRMLDEATRIGLTPKEQPSARDPHQQDFVHPLLDAFATTMHVLSFYQARVQEEGFLASAREARSVFEIARLVGVKRRPALCAESYVSLEAIDIPGDGQPMEIPTGLPIQSVPIKGGLPQIFETTEKLWAHPDWNRLTPSLERKDAAVRLWGNSIGVVFRGAGVSMKPGSPVLISGEIDGEPFTLVKTIRRVGRIPRRALSVLLWDEPLFPNQLDVVVERPRVTETSSPLPLFGSDAAEWSTMALDEQLKFSEAIGGFFRRDSPKDDWVRGTYPGTISCLFTSQDGTLYAGLLGQGIMRSDDGSTWSPANTKIRNSDVLCIAEDSTGSLLIGTRTKGAFRSPDQGATWNALQGVSAIVGAWPRVKRMDARLPDTPVRCIMGYTDPSGTKSFVLVGTDAGIFSFDQNTGHWLPVNEGLPGFEDGGKEALVSVRAIVANPGTGTVFAATDQGLFAAARLTKPWHFRPAAMDGVGITCLTIDDVGILYAGLDGGGAVMSEDNGVNWTSMGVTGTQTLGERKVRQIVAVRDDKAGREWVLAATDDGLMQSTDRGVRWARQSEEMTSQDICAVALSSRGAVFSASPITGVVDAEWPGFELGPDKLYLNKPLAASSGAEMGLIEQASDSDEEVLQSVLRIDGIQTVDTEGFNQRSQVSRLQLTDPAPDLAAYGRREALVRMAGKDMRLSMNQIVHTEPVADLNASLDPILAEPGVFDHMTTNRIHLEDAPREGIFIESPLPNFTNRWVGIVGRRLQLTTVAPVSLVNDATNTTQDYPERTNFEIQEWPTTTDDGALRWTLSDPLGFTGTVVLQPDEAKLLPSNLDAATVSMIRRVEIAAHRNGGTRLEFDLPLDVPVDLQGAVVHGNVTHVQHGQRVEEVLGNGNAGQAHQTFQLRQSPLSWHDLDGTPVPDIEIRVSGKPWRYTASFDACTAEEPVFTIEVDHEDITWVRFGDGIQGSRLPSGMENVLARMRVGSGEIGNVEAGHIRLLRDRPPILRNALNLVPASGGSPPESAEDLKKRIPRTVRLGRRVVSLSDFEDKVRTTPGVHHVLAETVWGGTQPVLFLTVTTTNTTLNHQLTIEDPLYLKLQREVQGAGMLGQTVQVEGHVQRPFELKLQVLITDKADADAAHKDIVALVVEQFAFQNRRLGQRVTATEIIAATSRQPGVLNVTIDTLRPVNAGADAPQFSPTLTARTAHWSPGQGKVIAAELLTLDTGRLHIEIERKDAP